MLADASNYSLAVAARSSLHLFGCCLTPQAHCDAVQASLGVPEGATSLLWICSSGQNHSQLTIIDANHPSDVLDSFYVTKSHVLCLGAVPGAADEDYGPLRETQDHQESGETPTNGATTEGAAAEDALAIVVSQVRCSVEDSEAEAPGADPEGKALFECRRFSASVC